MKPFALAAAILALAIASAPSPAAAQQDVRARLAGRVAPDLAAALDSAAAQATAQGLPIDPLIEKALEGTAKGVPTERIVAAVRALVVRLAAAAAALRQGGVAAPDADAIEAGAFAITAGLSESQVRDLTRASAVPHTPTSTLRVAATLVALGVPAAETVELLIASIRDGRSVGDLAALPGTIQGQVGRGVSPAQAARGLARTAASGRPPAPGRPSDSPGRRPNKP